MRKGINIGLIMVMLICFFAPMLPAKADENRPFELYLENSSGSNLIESYASYNEAYNAALAKEAEDVNNNLIIYNNGTIRYVTYGLLNFKTKANSGINTTYTIEYNRKQGYTNGYYGADAAFLGTNEDGSQIRFMQSGVIGWVNASEVSIINMNAENYKIAYVSSYFAKQLSDGTAEFRHSIVTDIFKPGLAVLTLGQEIPTGVTPSTEYIYYLSFDGHYFYSESLEGYRTMIRDYKNGVRTNSVNPNNPYYNYYQFLSHRSISNYTSDQIRQDLSIYSSKPISYPAGDGQSQLFGEETSFIQYQNEFGANAIMMLGTAKNESYNGKSNIAINTNNLFGHGAFDSAPGVSANRYISVAQGIYAHAKNFISEGYMDLNDYAGRYYGGYLGDKASGMNVKYASDPYWGEKAAANYYSFDKKYGLQDYGKYGIGIKIGSNSYPIKASPNSSSATLYETGPMTGYAATILSSVTGEEINGSNVWYKIQTDPVLNSSRTGMIQDSGYYDYNHNIGYIHSSYLSFVRNGQNEKNRYTISFNPNGGKFSDGITSTKNLTVEEYVIPNINPPSKDGARFIGWDKEVVGATENVTYTAIYSSHNYNITFHAGQGKFDDNSITKVISVVAGEIPNIGETPKLEGYEFVGWSPVLSAASKNTTYTARYQKIGEIEYQETDGEFYFHELTSDASGLNITGYSTVNGIQINSSSNVTYAIEFENVDTNEITSMPLSRIMDQSKMPFLIGNINGYDATYAWFNGTISLNNLKEGNYRAYIVTKSGALYSRKLVRNLFGKTMTGNYEQDGRQVWIRNNYYLKTVPIEFFVRNQIVGKKNNNPIDNMITGYSNISFEGNKLKIRGFAHNVNGDYSLNASVSRTIMLENTATYKKISGSLSTITDGDYAITLRVPDGFDKTKAWFDGEIDISNLEKGTYAIYIANEANINDFAELNDIFGKTITSKTTINGKNYSLKVNSDARYRVELIVE